MRAVTLVAALALGGCTPPAFAPATQADSASAANGAWAGRLECFAGGGPRLYADLPNVAIADGAMSVRDTHAQLDGRFNAAGQGDVVGYIRTIDGEWIPLGLDVALRDGRLSGDGRYESAPKPASGGRSGRVASARPDDPRGPCRLELERR